MMAPVVELIDVQYAVNGRVVVSGLNLAIERGRITAVMGPSGTGKTTLLRLITGQVTPDRGRVVVEGQDLAGLSARELYRLRLRMGMLFQNDALFTDLTVFENVAFALREHTNLPEALIRLIVLTKLHAVGLRGAADLAPAELSGGMARRVALARAIAMDPPLLFCDEPFTGLDPISIGMIAKLLRRLNEGLGITTVVVSHDVPEVERVADTSCILANGQIAAIGRPDELRHNDAELVRQFMNGSPDGPIPFHYPARDYREDLLRISK